MQSCYPHMWSLRRHPVVVSDDLSMKRYLTASTIPSACGGAMAMSGSLVSARVAGGGLWVAIMEAQMNGPKIAWPGLPGLLKSGHLCLI